MIGEFEARLADVLGARLPPPFTGRVDVAPAAVPPGDAPQVVLGAILAEPVDPDLGSRRPEEAPGADDPRRVLRLRCTVGLRVVAADGEGREQQRAGVDAAIYQLDAPDVRDGTALAGEDDPGFVIHTLGLVDAGLPLDPGDDDPAVITLSAEGWFWPVGEVGEAGEPILEAHIREAVVPITVTLAPPVPLAGGPDVTVTIQVGEGGALLVDADGVEPLPFGRLALALEAPGGKPGAGSLAGGAAGPSDTRLVTPADGAALVTYRPPAEPAVDMLIVTLEDLEAGRGIELGRIPIKVLG